MIAANKTEFIIPTPFRFWLRNFLPAGRRSPRAPTEIAIVSNGIICIKFFGLPSVLYEIQTATNLAGTWIPIATNTAGSDGSWLFTDSSATNIQQYYRSRSIQP